MRLSWKVGRFICVLLLFLSRYLFFVHFPFHSPFTVFDEFTFAKVILPTWSEQHSASNNRLLRMCFSLDFGKHQLQCLTISNPWSDYDMIWQWKNINHILSHSLSVSIPRTHTICIHLRQTMIETKIYCFHVYFLYCHEHCSFDAFPLHFVAQILRAIQILSMEIRSG